MNFSAYFITFFTASKAGDLHINTHVCLGDLVPNQLSESLMILSWLLPCAVSSCKPHVSVPKHMDTHMMQYRHVCLTCQWCQTCVHRMHVRCHQEPTFYKVYLHVLPHPQPDVVMGVLVKLKTLKCSRDAILSAVSRINCNSRMLDQSWKEEVKKIKIRNFSKERPIFKEHCKSSGNVKNT